MTNTPAHPIQDTARLLRVRDIIGDPFANPPIKPIIPVCRTTWWNGVKSGRFPKPIKLGPRVTAWRHSDVIRLIEEKA